MTTINDLASAVSPPVNQKNTQNRVPTDSPVSAASSVSNKQNTDAQSNASNVAFLPTAQMLAEAQSEQTKEKHQSEQQVKEEITAAVTQLNDFVQNVARDLMFSIDDESGRSVMRVIERNSGELIRQIPSEEALKLAQLTAELQQDNDPVKILFDGTA